MQTQAHQPSKTANITEMRRRLLEGRIGDFAHISAEELLEMAASAERTMKEIGPFDPAYTYFVQQRDDYLKAAVMNEEADNAAPAV